MRGVARWPRKGRGRGHKEMRGMEVVERGTALRALIEGETL